MQRLAHALLALGACCAVPAWGGSASPVQKVVQLLSDIQAKVLAEGEAAHKAYEEYSEWCEDRSKNLAYEVKTAKSEVAELEAAILKCTSMIESLTAAIGDTSSKIATNEADLKAAVAIRTKEEADFSASEKELVEVISMLERAIGILEREARKGGSAMLQLQGASGVLQALHTMVEASMLGAQDASRLTALVQSSQEDEGSSEALGAPDAATYESHSGSIIETLEGLLDKAQDQLDTARTTETSSRHSFEMLKQSLMDELKFGGQDMDKAKKDLAAQKERKATAQGDLAMTSKDLAQDEQTMGNLKQDCVLRAQDYEAATKSRDEEVKALAAAKKAISEMSMDAGDLTYGQASFLQLTEASQSSITTGADLANFEAVRFIRNLAREQHSEALAQLARRMSSAIRYGTAAGEDPFAKVKGLIRDMLERLEKEAQADASHKAYCDKEIGETLQKKVVKEAEVDKLSTTIDSMTAGSAKLKEQVASLQKALADLAKAQAEMTEMRQEEKAKYLKNKPEMEEGIQGVKMALKLLREYYAKEGKAHTAAEGGASGVIGLLEVVESDFSKLLAEMSAAEANAQATYDQETRANEIERATKESDVKYKTAEYKQLDAAVSEASSDRESVQAELSAVLDYKTHLQQICTSKPETYSERAARREAELAGLKQALSILEGEAVLLQRHTHSSRQHSLRSGAAILPPSA